MYYYLQKVPIHVCMHVGMHVALLCTHAWHVLHSMTDCLQTSDPPGDIADGVFPDTAQYE